jgi:hypothetical protein
VCSEEHAVARFKLITFAKHQRGWWKPVLINTLTLLQAEKGNNVYKNKNTIPGAVN